MEPGVDGKAQRGQIFLMEFYCLLLCRPSCPRGAICHWFAHLFWEEIDWLIVIEQSWMWRVTIFAAEVDLTNDVASTWVLFWLNLILIKLEIQVWVWQLWEVDLRPILLPLGFDFKSQVSGSGLAILILEVDLTNAVASALFPRAKSHRGDSGVKNQDKTCVTDADHEIFETYKRRKV